ncbi:neutral zinc metallopeptidase [Kutzneria sp. NPDC052558]|uniref:neutral zinc metallopeptidase n=1 Tax=Kutzneria sp. NPDC052558 TaxID=3364121 RepID=UPI0037CC4E2C
MPPPLSNGPGPPRRRPSRAPVVAIVVVAAVLIGVAAIGLSRLGYSRPAAESGATPTAMATLDPPTTTTTPSRTTPRTTTPPPTTTSRHPSTSSAPPSSAQPAGPRAVVKLGDNPLFEVGGLPPTNCKLSRWTTDPAGAERFFRSALPCLDAAWAPVMKAANLPFSPPDLAFPGGTTWHSQCGSEEAGSGRVAAFYCPTDNTIYMPFSALQTDMYGAHPGTYLAVFAHEYGHHVQDLAGIEDAYTQATYATRSPDERMELSRRLELEAQCFSGMFLAATAGRGDVDDNITREAQNSQDRGDHNGPPRDHGTDEHAMGWWNSGFQRNSLSQCDTWLASAADVA